MCSVNLGVRPSLERHLGAILCLIRCFRSTRIVELSHTDTAPRCQDGHEIAWATALGGSLRLEADTPALIPAI